MELSNLTLHYYNKQLSKIVVNREKSWKLENFLEASKESREKTVKMAKAFDVPVHPSIADVSQLADIIENVLSDNIFWRSDLRSRVSFMLNLLDAVKESGSQELHQSVKEEVYQDVIPELIETSSYAQRAKDFGINLSDEDGPSRFIYELETEKYFDSDDSDFRSIVLPYYEIEEFDYLRPADYGTRSHDCYYDGDDEDENSSLIDLMGEATGLEGADLESYYEHVLAQD